MFVNCFDLAEAERVIAAIKLAIDPAYLVGSHSKIGKRAGLPFKEITVKAVRLDFYSKGVKDMNPDYLKAFI